MKHHIPFKCFVLRFQTVFSASDHYNNKKSYYQVNGSFGNLYLLFNACFVDCGRICLSCSGVESVGECSDVEICADDEVHTNGYGH